MYNSDNDNGGITRTIVTGQGRDNSITLVAALGLLSGFAAIVGGFVGGAAAVIGNSPYLGKFILGGMAAGLAVAFVVSFRKLFYLIEVFLKLDIDHNGTIGDPGQMPLPETKYLQPVWVPNPENPKNQAVRVDVETPHDDTLARMAVILMVKGWDYFTGQNFSSSKSETQLMSEDHWRDVFLPQLVAARLVETKADARGRNRVVLSDQGKTMFQKLAGQAGRGLEAGEQIPLLEAEYASETTSPLPRKKVSGLSGGQKTR